MPWAWWSSWTRRRRRRTAVEADGAAEAEADADAVGVVVVVDSAAPPPHATAKRRANEERERMVPFIPCSRALWLAQTAKHTVAGSATSRTIAEIARSR
jgi:hypothetical protein